MSNAQRTKNITKILKRYKDLLKKDKFPVRKMILYGSYAKGNSMPYSDIDVCIISSKLSKNKDRYETYLWKKVLEVDTRIEPIGYYPAEFKDIDPLVHEIKRCGVVIK